MVLYHGSNTILSDFRISWRNSILDERVDDLYQAILEEEKLGTDENKQENTL